MNFGVLTGVINAPGAMILAWFVPCELLGGILLRGVTYKYNKVFFIFFYYNSCFLNCFFLLKVY